MTLPARAVDQRGRPFLNAARTSLVADNGRLLRGPATGTEYGGSLSLSYVQYIASRGCNAVHLYAEDFVSGYAAGSMSNDVDQVVAMTRTNGIYLIITIANSWANGSNSLSFATNFWSFYAPRYANEKHVLFEIHNEPVAWGPPYSATNANPPGALDMEAACYKIIRANAPNTPVLLFTYAVLSGSGGAAAALTDIQAFNTNVFGSANAVWTNEAVAFHGYAGADATSNAVAQIIAAGYPCFMTEFSGSIWGTGVGSLDLYQVAYLERLGVSWLDFQFGTGDQGFKDVVNWSGLSWTPDFGNWPPARGPYGNGGYPWTTPGLNTNNILTGSLRIQAENFDSGGEGVAYHELTTTNLGGQYRTNEAVDIETTSDAGGGYDVTGTAAGEWLEYTVDVSEPGYYNLALRVAGTAAGSVQLLAGGINGTNLTGTWTVPATGGAQTWMTISNAVFLTPGQQVLHLDIPAGGFNLNWMELSPITNGIIANGTYKFLNAATALTPTGVTSNSTIIASSYSGSTYQQWNLQHLGAGQYRITCAANGYSLTGSSGFYWWNSEHFIIESTSGGHFRLQSTGGSCLETVSGNPASLDEAIYSGGANLQWAIVSPSAPAFPTGLSALAVSSTQISLTWNAVTNAISYILKRSSTSGGPYTTIATGVTATNYLDTGASVSAGCYYLVSAMVGGSESANSAEAAISFPKLTGGTIGTSGSWNSTGNTISNVFDNNLNTFFDGPDASGDWVGLNFGASVTNIIMQLNYCPRSAWGSRMVGGIFQGANNSNFTGAVTLCTITNQPTAGVFTSVNITNATAFRYVRYLSPANGFCNVAELEFYGYSSFTSATAPAAPGGLVAAAVSSSQINLNWNASAGATNYKVKRSATNGGPYLVVASGTTATNYNDTGLAAATTYYYVVSALNAGSESTNSAQASATTAVPIIPAGWGDVDVGSPAFAGSDGYDSNTVWTVTGSGADIWNNGDQFNYCTNSLNGDGMLLAHVLAQSGTEAWAQSGIMFRDGLASNAPQVSLMITPGNGVSFRYRYTAGGVTYQVNQTGITAPAWVRLSRSTNTFTASYSTGGTSWTQLGTPQTVSMNSSILAGLAVTAHNNSLTNVATFNSLLLEAGPQVAPPSDLANEMAWQTTWPLPQLNVASNSLRPAMGWNAWFVVAGLGASESLVFSTADAMATNGLGAAGYKYVNIDGTWIATPGRGSRDASGHLIPETNSYWPHGMKYVSDYVHAKGLLMGGYSDIGAIGYGITNSQIGMFGYYQQDANQFAAWEWDYVKIDDHGPGDFYAAAYAVANNASRRPMVVSLSCPQTDAVKFGPRLANSYRVSTDISLVYNGSVAWSSILREFDADQARWFTQAPGHWNDPDFCCTGMYGISDLEGRTHFNLWCILGAPLILGTDVRSTGGALPPPMSGASLATLTNAEAIALDQDALGAVGRTVANDVHVKPLGSYISGQYGVLLLNRSSSVADRTVNWVEVGLVAGSTATVRDLWAHADLGSFAGSYTVTNIPAHGSVLLKVAGTFDWNRPRTYEAEWAYNSFSGNAYYVPNTSSFSSSAYVTGVGNGLANAFQFNLVAAPSNGLYQLDIYYACAAARTARLSVNGGAVTNLNFPATGGDTQPSSITAYLQLAAGNTNTLTFGNISGLAPNFDKIVVSSGSPATLTAAAGDGVVNLAWTASAGSASFNLYRGTASGGEAATPMAPGLTGSAFADTNVVNGQTYFYTVTAINPMLGGESPPSVEASAQPRYATASAAYQTAILAAAPVVWWRLNETNGALLYDAIGNQKGTNAGAVVLGSAGPRPPDFLGFEMTNTAAQFANGTTNSWINVPALNLNTNTVTITAWIYPFSTMADYAGVCIYRSGGTVAGINYGGSVGANTGMIGYTWNNDQNTWNWTSGLTPPANQWSFVALVVQPASATMYLVTTNGRQSATNTYAHPSQGFSGAGTIGTDAYDAVGRAFNGLVDEVAVFNYALTLPQIQSLFASGSQLPAVQVGCQSGGGYLNVTWPQGTLLQSTNLTGPWSRASASASPLVVAPTNNLMFYRVLLKQ